MAKELDRYYQIKYARAINRTFDCSKLYSIIGPLDFVKPEEGLAKCLSEFLENPKFLPLNYKAHAYFDKLSGEKMKYSEFSSLKQYAKYLYAKHFKF